MDIESIYNISVNNIRIFLFFIEFLDTSYTCDYFSITRQHLSNVLKGIEKNFNTKIFDNNNLVNTEAFFYIKKSLYNYLINVFNILNNKILDIDIGYTELLPYRIVIDIYKKNKYEF
ncbi:MAG: hypothetical protein KatS3mg068_0269 [Candidatus Sericytochromatia bacterium]|nr:MAG: hypothetical protein KatS3mg068_0269 [Candidatus Sericytochromatia bacterium]